MALHRMKFPPLWMFKYSLNINVGPWYGTANYSITCVIKILANRGIIVGGGRFSSIRGLETDCVEYRMENESWHEFECGYAVSEAIYTGRNDVENIGRDKTGAVPSDSISHSVERYDNRFETDTHGSRCGNADLITIASRGDRGHKVEGKTESHGEFGATPGQRYRFRCSVFGKAPESERPCPGAWPKLKRSAYTER